MIDNERATRMTKKELTQAIFQSAITILNESGYENVTFSNVARLAKTGRPVLYRRWKTPFDLLLDAVTYFSEDEVTDYSSIDFSGETLRDNLISVLSHFDASPQFMRAFLFELGRDTPSVQKYSTQMRQQNLYLMEQLLSQAQLNGEIQHTVTDDIKLLPFNLLQYQAMMTPNDMTTQFVTDFAVRIVDHIVLPAILAQQKE
ncbi:TetR/AcrR family transcriptional regulator [Dellaglioa sp. L3N]